MYRFLFFLLVLHSSVFSEDPWGEDIELIEDEKCQKRQEEFIFSLPVFLSEELIHFHQKAISPADGPRSHYIPSSSQYALEAIQKYGFLKGFVMGCDRLMRENDESWVYLTVPFEDDFMKYDPVK